MADGSTRTFNCPSTGAVAVNLGLDVASAFLNLIHRFALPPGHLTVAENALTLRLFPFRPSSSLANETVMDFSLYLSLAMTFRVSRHSSRHY